MRRKKRAQITKNQNEIERKIQSLFFQSKSEKWTPHIIQHGGPN